MSYRAVAGEKHQQRRTPGLVFFTNRAAIRNMHKSNVSLIFFIGMSYRAVAGEKHQQRRKRQQRRSTPAFYSYRLIMSDD